jgi:hypothetical protein
MIQDRPTHTHAHTHTHTHTHCIYVYMFVWFFYTSLCVPAVCISLAALLVSVYLGMRSFGVTTRFEVKMIQQQELNVQFHSKIFDRSFFCLRIEVKRRVSVWGVEVGVG